MSENVLCSDKWPLDTLYLYIWKKERNIDAFFLGNSAEFDAIISTKREGTEPNKLSFR